MSRISAELKAFGLQYMRNPIGAFFVFAFPIILIMVFGAMFSPAGPPEAPPLPVQDLDGTALSGEFLENINQTSIAEISMIPTTADIEDYVREESLSVAMVIPVGFEANAQSNTSVNVTLYGDMDASLYWYIATVADLAAEELDKYLIIPGRTVPDRVLGTEWVAISPEEFSFIQFFLPGMIALTVLLNGLMILSALSAEYKSKGYFKLLSTTPLKKSEWILSKFIWYLIVMMLSIFLMLLIGIGAFGADVAITPIAIALILAGILLFTSFGLLIGIWAKNSDAAAAIGNAIGFPMMFLSGLFWPLDTMPEAMQYIAYVFPLTYFGEGLRATMTDGNDGLALMNLAVLLVLAVVFFIVATKLMKWKEK
ncbi:MAG: ABC transporter permease [Methanobacteriota archaeon]|nr:MAG: ABC transporter permease [Euryarchaeota archaeon]